MGKFQQLINDQKASINQRPNKMTVHITPEISATSNDIFKVNNKTVSIDMDGDWICKGLELTDTEKRFFIEYLEMLSKTSAKIVTVTYNA